MKRIGIFLAALATLGLPFAMSLPATAQQGGGWGTVKGRIVWPDDKLPGRPPIAAIETNADKAHCLGAGKILSEEWVVNPKNKGVKYAFVWLINDNPKDKTPLPIHPDLKQPKNNEVVMDQPVCMFVPHAVGMREGQVLVAKNSSPVAHNFKWTGNQLTKNAGGNVQIPAGSQFAIKGLEADRLPIKVECNIHPWMNGWVRVYDHPYFAVTDADGKFELKNAPAGKYRAVIWHGSGGFLGGAAGRYGQPIEIKADGTVDLGELGFKTK